MRSKVTNNSHILYISYNGLLGEILPSQVIPYLRELVRKGYNFTLLTFERNERLRVVGKEGVVRLKNELKAMGIDWHWLHYHKRIPLLATSFDILLGTLYALYLVITKKVKVIHARSIVPATMAFVYKLFNVRFVFDTRGLLAEEYVGDGHWKEGCLEYRLVKFFERLCLRLADTIVVLTERHREYLLNLPMFRNRNENIFIELIPCCVDLDRFGYSFPQADVSGKKENLENNFIFAYLGKIGKRYMLAEMVDFLKSAFETLPNSKFMILTQSDQQKIMDIILSKRMDLEKVIIKKPNFEEIPSLVSAANAGIFFINPHKRFGPSPIKLGEFLSCGIPVIINSGIGDTEELVEANKVGVVVKSFDDNGYTTSLYELLSLMKEGELLNRRCRKTAERYLSLDFGLKKYNSIYERLKKEI